MKLLVAEASGAGNVLDVACAGGSLYSALEPNNEGYVGIVTSEVAVRAAKTRYPRAEISLARLEDYQPQTRFDAVVFSEVLYYLDVTDAVYQVLRYSKFFTENGRLVISMKHDPEPKRLFKELESRFTWAHGVLFQEKINGAEYVIGQNPARPAYLVASLKVS